jgi:hypothetical protein
VHRNAIGAGEMHVLIPDGSKRESGENSWRRDSRYVLSRGGRSLAALPSRS